MTYTIGEIEELSGIKANILRYWETIIPGFAPKKDSGGRRVYTEKDFELVLRLKHLIYEKKFTIEGARNEILHQTERYESKTEIMSEINDIRTELTKLYMTVRKYRQK